MNGALNHNQRVGARGEDAATEFLKVRGYEILHRNWRCRQGEIDIIARKEEVLVFVEVKSNLRGGFGEPELRVDQRKQRKLVQTGLTYWSQVNEGRDDCRFDVVGVTFAGGEASIHHIPDAFQPDPSWM